MDCTYFGRFGELTDAVVMIDARSGKPRGFGFVTFAEASSVAAVTAERYHHLDGRWVEVKSAVPQSLIKDFPEVTELEAHQQQHLAAEWLSARAHVHPSVGHTVVPNAPLYEPTRISSPVPAPVPVPPYDHAVPVYDALGYEYHAAWPGAAVPEGHVMPQIAPHAAAVAPESLSFLTSLQKIRPTVPIGVPHGVASYHGQLPLAGVAAPAVAAAVVAPAAPYMGVPYLVPFAPAPAWDHGYMHMPEAAAYDAAAGMASNAYNVAPSALAPGFVGA